MASCTQTQLREGQRQELVQDDDLQPWCWGWWWGIGTQALILHLIIELTCLRQDTVACKSKYNTC